MWFFVFSFFVSVKYRCALNIRLFEFAYAKIRFATFERMLVEKKTIVCLTFGARKRTFNFTLMCLYVCPMKASFECILFINWQSKCSKFSSMIVYRFLSVFNYSTIVSYNKTYLNFYYFMHILKWARPHFKLLETFILLRKCIMKIFIQVRLLK